MFYKYVLIIFFVLVSNVFSKAITKNDALTVAKNIVLLKNNLSNTVINSIEEINSEKYTYMYIVNFKDIGFVIVSADDRTYPILGYSFNNEFSFNDAPIQLIDMLEYYKKQIHYIIENNLTASNSTDSLWMYYLSDNLIIHNNRNVNPLLNLNWDQGHSWNDHCPIDNQGPGGNAYAGCVATAGAMVMKYWNHPEYGEGSHAFEHNDYGLIMADFNTFYDWNNMDGNSPTEASRKLLFHLGVSVEMNYGPSGSGAWVGEYEPSLTTALKSYFKYDQGTTFLSKDNYDDVFWVDMVKNELDEGRPLIYKGYTQDLGAGHAFVVNGYDEYWKKIGE